MVNQTGWLTGDAGETADLLAALLASRLSTRVQLHPAEWQRKHECWTVFAAENVSIGAALKVALGQTKDLEDLRGCDDCSELWTHNVDAFIPITGDMKKFVGSYFTRFAKWARQIRAGKVYGADANYGTRIDQHKKGSRLDNAESQRSNFYQKFPSASSVNSTPGMRKGTFEELQFFIGTAFRKDKVDALLKDVSEGGIFRWSPKSLRLARTKVHLGSNLEEKQLQMVAHLLEVFDGLMMETAYNVSESLGMDIFMRGKGDGGGDDEEARRLF
jgi:hypothetical protein